MFKRLLSLALTVMFVTSWTQAQTAGGDTGQETPAGPVTLTAEPTTATFTFNLGTENQRATFSNEYMMTSKVTYGSNLTLEGTDNKGYDQTWFGVAKKESKAAETNQIHFTIQPRFGYKFTPTKVSYTATRYGTGGGLLDTYWENPDGTTVKLDSSKNPNRDNDETPHSDYSYTVTGAKVDEGACGLMINLYSLDNGKHVGFRNIVIEGYLDGTEVEIPILASFTANGVEYNADEIFEAAGDNYTATIELAAAETMISATNPVTDVKASKGEVGAITYSGDNSTATVTIPVSLAGKTINYIATFVRKPMYTLSYINTDGGTVMGTQKVEKDATIKEFAIDYTTATADDGYRVRGWFTSPTGGQKYTVDDVITGDITLYAWQSPIEVAGTHQKYTFDLKSKTFYPEDHEAFNTDNGYWHDATHGWAFKNGDKIDLLVGPKASVSIALCRYGYGTEIAVTDEAGNNVATVKGMSKGEPDADGNPTEGTDGEVVAFDYEGTGGTLTLTIGSEGEMYLHSIKIMNTTEVNYTHDGQWYFVKPGDATSLIDVIEAVSTINANATAERAFIFIPDGKYDLKQTVLTNLSGHNISLIGQSRDKTLIVNAPHSSTEGISSTATLMNTGNNNYLQDITIQNALDYYGALDAKQVGGRAVAWWDKGTNTVCKNIVLLSYQDTYYSNNVNGQYYWENSEIHGTVDFFCGEGAMFFTKGTIVVEKRNANGKGECTLTAPATKKGNRYGYVFEDCNLVNYAEKYNLGRAWSNEPRCAYINLTLDDKSKLNSNRWTAAGMNVCAKEFVEYNMMDADGNVISPSSKKISFTHSTGNNNNFETILTAEQAAEFTLDKVFTDWKPADLAAQVAAPAPSFKTPTTIEWPAVDGASAYAVFKNGELAGITTTTTFTTPDNKGDYTVRAANSMGGLGAAGIATGGAGINGIDADTRVVSTVYYNVQGMTVDAGYRGIVVKVEKLSDGTTIITKIVNR